MGQFKLKSKDNLAGIRLHSSSNKGWKKKSMPTLMRHYACGVKVPSAKRLQKIREALHKLGRELLSA